MAEYYALYKCIHHIIQNQQRCNQCHHCYVHTHVIYKYFDIIIMYKLYHVQLLLLSCTNSNINLYEYYYMQLDVHH